MSRSERSSRVAASLDALLSRRTPTVAEAPIGSEPAAEGGEVVGSAPNSGGSWIDGQDESDRLGHTGAPAAAAEAAASGPDREAADGASVVSRSTGSGAEGADGDDLVGRSAASGGEAADGDDLVGRSTASGAGGVAERVGSGAAGGAGPVGELLDLPVDAVVPNEFQPRQRFDEASLEALTASVREMGVLQPILVRRHSSDLYELIAGERRWRAARRAGLATVPALVRDTADQGALEEAIVENLHRSDLSAIEEASAYQQLVEDFGLTQDEVAVRVGKSRSAVSNTIRLLQLPAAVQRLVTDGLLSAGHARAILAVGEASRQTALAERVIAEELTVRATEQLVRSEAWADDDRAGAEAGDVVGERRGGASLKSAGALEVERALEDRLATRVEVVETEGAGRIVIRFADVEDLDRIYRLLGE